MLPRSLPARAFGAACFTCLHVAVQVVRYDREGRRLGVVANGGPLRGPAGIRFGPSAELLVTSYDNHRVFVYNSSLASPMEVRIVVSDSTKKARKLIR